MSSSGVLCSMPFILSQNKHCRHRGGWETSNKNGQRHEKTSSQERWARPGLFVLERNLRGGGRVKAHKTIKEQALLFTLSHTMKMRGHSMKLKVGSKFETEKMKHDAQLASWTSCHREWMFTGIMKTSNVRKDYKLSWTRDKWGWGRFFHNGLLKGFLHPSLKQLALPTVRDRILG